SRWQLQCGVKETSLSKLRAMSKYGTHLLRSGKSLRRIIHFHFHRHHLDLFFLFQAIWFNAVQMQRQSPAVLPDAEAVNSADSCSACRPFSNERMNAQQPLKAIRKRNSDFCRNEQKCGLFLAGE